MACWEVDEPRGYRCSKCGAAFDSSPPGDEVAASLGLHEIACWNEAPSTIKEMEFCEP